MRKRVAFLSIVLALALVLVWLWDGHQPISVNAAPALSAATTTVAQLHAPDEGPGRILAPGEAPVPESSPIPIPTPTDTASFGSSRYQRLDEALASESADPTWSPAMEATIARLIEDIPIPRLKTDIECRTTICRVVVTHEFGVEALGELDFSAFSKAFASLPEIHYPRIKGIRTSTFPVGPGQFQGHLETRIYLTAANFRQDI